MYKSLALTLNNIFYARTLKVSAIMINDILCAVPHDYDDRVYTSGHRVFQTILDQWFAHKRQHTLVVTLCMMLEPLAATPCKNQCLHCFSQESFFVWIVLQKRCTFSLIQERR